jgi:hypothetical protein
MVARVAAVRARRLTAPPARSPSGWPASRLNGTSPIRLLAAATLLTLGVALSAGGTGADHASAAPAAATALVAAGR